MHSNDERDLQNECEPSTSAQCTEGIKIVNAFLLHMLVKSLPTIKPSLSITC